MSFVKIAPISRYFTLECWQSTSPTSGRPISTAARGGVGVGDANGVVASERPFVTSCTRPRGERLGWFELIVQVPRKRRAALVVDCARDLWLAALDDVEPEVLRTDDARCRGRAARSPAPERSPRGRLSPRAAPKQAPRAANGAREPTFNRFAHAPQRNPEQFLF